MDITNIITALSGIYITSFILDNLIEGQKGIKILKTNKQRYIDAYNIIDKIDKKALNQNQDLDINLLLQNLSYPNELKNIVITFKNYVDNENFNMCLQRLNTLQINYINILNDIKKYLQNFFENDGAYIPIDNTIDVYTFFDKESVLSHEFLHMASTGNDGISGFCTLLKDVWIGDGLDEGYTELLNSRIFKSKNISYKYNIEIVKLIEILFDNPKDMQYAYFHNNIFIVYKTFLKYGTKEEFFKTIQTLDNLSETDIPIYKRLTATKTKLNLYQIIKRSNNQEKIKQAENLLDQDSLLKIIKPKIKKNIIKKGNLNK